MLTVRQKRFAEEYLVCGEGKAAAIAAGYSSRSAKQTACKLLAHPEVSAAIADGLGRITERAERKVEEYLKRVDQIAFATPSAVWSEQSILKAAELGMRARKMLTDRVETDQVHSWESLVPKRRGVLGLPLEQFVPRRTPSTETAEVPPAEPVAELPPEPSELERISTLRRIVRGEPAEPEPSRTVLEGPRPAEGPTFATTEMDHVDVLKRLRS